MIWAEPKEVNYPVEYVMVKAGDVNSALQFLEDIESAPYTSFKQGEIQMYRLALEKLGLTDDESQEIAVSRDSSIK